MNAEPRYVDVVDDDPEFAQSVSWILSSIGYAVQIFTTAPEFLDRVSPALPRAVMIDLLLPAMTGLSLCRELVARQLPCAFVMVSGHADVASVVETMRLGAIDFLEKPFTRQRLLEVADAALRAACRKQKRQREEEQVDRCLEALSAREREVFDAMGAGLVTKEIARRLGISARTVDVHRSRIMQKLSVGSPAQLGSLLAIVERKTLRGHLNDSHLPPANRCSAPPTTSSTLSTSNSAISAVG